MEEEKKVKISNKVTFSQMKKIYKYAKSSRKYIILFLFTSLILCGISVASPILAAKEVLYLTTNVLNQLLIVALVIFVMDLSYNLVRAIGTLAVNKFYLDITEQLRIELSRETLKITTDEMNKNTSGVFLERINNDASEVSDIFGNLIETLTDLVTKLGVFIAVFFINKLIFCLFLLFILVIAEISKRSSNAITAKDKIRKKNREKVAGFTSEIVRGSKDIKVLNAEESFISKTKELTSEAKKVHFDYIKTRAKWHWFSGSVHDSLSFLITMSLIACIYSKQLSIASALIIYNYTWYITSIAREFNYLLEYWKKFQLSSNRIFGIIDGNEFQKEKFGNNKLDSFKGNIEFKNVNFSYEKKLPIIKDMSFKIKENQTVAFVGRSGAGKTTIFNLLSLLYDNYNGDILFDGVNIKGLDKESVRGNLSIISQNPYIYNLSIKENLTIIKRDATDEDINRVLKLACLDEFVNSLPDGVDSIVGEGGVTLSGGQRQRLAIARALLQGTKLILFDEATSALDNETQSKIQEAIHNMKGDYTIIIIAHRLTTVKDSDNIFVVDDGTIVDQGTEEELLKKSPVFKTLYNNELEK